MIVDTGLFFWDNEDMGGWAIGNHDSTVVTMPVDGSSSTGANIVSDRNLKIYISISEAVAPLTATLLFAVLGSVDGSTNWRSLRSSRSQLASVYVKGYIAELTAMPYEAWPYLRLRCTVATAALTAGHVNAFLVVNPQTERSGAV